VTKEAERGLDIVMAILTLVRERSPEFSPEQALEVEQEVRQRYGGLYTRIAKRKPHPTSEQRRRIRLEILTDAEDSEIMRANNISRATLYRYQKKPDEVE
jgi:DNA invertase Pin-like site-specific DNA recombinase